MRVVRTEDPQHVRPRRRDLPVAAQSDLSQVARAATTPPRPAVQVPKVGQFRPQHDGHLGGGDLATLMETELAGTVNSARARDRVGVVAEHLHGVRSGAARTFIDRFKMSRDD